MFFVFVDFSCVFDVLDFFMFVFPTTKHIMFRLLLLHVSFFFFEKKEIIKHRTFAENRNSNFRMCFVFLMFQTFLIVFFCVLGREAFLLNIHLKKKKPAHGLPPTPAMQGALDRVTDRLKETDRQAGKQTDRQTTDTHTDRHTDTHT